MPSVVVVTLLYTPPLLRFDQEPPLSVLTCHWYKIVPMPVAATLKLAALPLHTFASAGWVLIVGAVSSVRIAALEVMALQFEVMMRKRYWKSFKPETLLIIRVFVPASL